MSDEYPTIGKGRMRRLEQKAVKLGWVIPQDAKQKIVDVQVDIATGGDAEASAREKTAAAKCLAQMEGQNIAIAATPALNQEEKTLEPVSPAQLLAELQKTIPHEAD